MDKYQLAFKVITYYEGWSSTPYHDSVGVKTVGWGRTYGDLDTPTTKAIEKKYLREELEVINECINLNVRPRMSSHEMASLMSLTYNIGRNAFRNSTLVKRINDKDSRAADEFLRWSLAGGRVLPGLAKRRMTEYILFREHMLTFF